MDIERIKSSILVTENGCWEWQKSCNSAGYGQLTENKKYWLTHRYSFSCFNNLQKHDVLRHKCHNTRCCNPEHLEIGTHKDNYNDSKDVHKKAAAVRRKSWSVGGVSYGTSREVVEKTGLSMNSVIKYTKDGVFDIESYREACKKAACKPKV